jgi:hypothetical protein
MADACKAELAQFKIDRATNINKDITLGETPGATKLCRPLLQHATGAMATMHPTHLLRVLRCCVQKSQANFSVPPPALACKEDVTKICGELLDPQDPSAALACLR